MITLLPTIAIEESTYIIKVEFFDEDGAAMTPNTILWTLTDLSNMVINSRVNEVVTPTTVIYIVLSGDDLRIFGVNDTEKRKITISGTYNSSYGSNLPYNEATQFSIYNIGFILHNALMDEAESLTITEQVALSII